MYGSDVLYLASQSPRRRHLLEQLGYACSVVDVEVHEVRRADEAPESYVRRVAREKAGAGLMELAAVPNAVVIGADTEVVLDARVFGKPRDAQSAAAMLRELSGRDHEVLTSVWVLTAGDEQHAISRSIVRLAALNDAEIEAYVASGEALGKAGAYAIQGRAAAFVERLEGSHSGVMGLPLFETARLLSRFRHLRPGPSAETGTQPSEGSAQ